MSPELLELFERVRLSLEPTYRVQRQIGVGGMAIVYLAQDIRHERPVAIKVLKPDVAYGAPRFLREIRFAARLAHPHILPMLASGEACGLPYYVMPYVEGESLRERLAVRGRMPVSEALRFVRQVADGLHYAHAAKIIHRDIKPENILLLSDNAVIADFGIARAVDVVANDGQSTGAGIALGTPAYLSPEQAAGEGEVDGRSDVYSLALVLHEMLSGEPAFKGKSAQAIIAKRFTEKPRALSLVRDDVPAEVELAIAAALSLDPADRPPTALAFSKALVAADQGTPARTWSGGVATGPLEVPRYATLSSESELPSIAVLPFANLSSDPENDFFSDGLTEDVIGALGRLRTVRVAARASSFAFKGRRDDVRTMGEQLRVSTLLDGSVRRAGRRVRIGVQLVDVKTGYEMWSDQLDRELDDAFALQDEIARSIALALNARLGGDAAPRTEHPVPGDVYELYLRGRHALNQRTEKQLRAAIGLFTEAAERDPEFVLAQSAVAEAHMLLGIYGCEPPSTVMPLARQAAERALKLDPALPDAYVMLGTTAALFDWNWSASEDAFRRAITLAPQHATAHQRLAVDLLVPKRRVEEARAVMRRALALDPLAPAVQTSVGVVWMLTGDPARAVDTLTEVAARNPDFVMARYFLGGAQREAGNLPAALATFESLVASGAATPEMLAGQGQAMALAGDVDGARRVLDRLIEWRRSRYLPPTVIAQMLAAIGEHDRALVALEEAAEERDPDLIFIDVRPVYLPLRKDARFEALRRRLHVA